MPFTLAHPALVLPLRRSGLPLTALVAGSLSPDVPLYVPGGLLGSRDEGHSWTHTWFGLAVFDLPVGILMVVAWTYLLAEPLRDAAPDALRDRPRRRRALPRSAWWSVPLAVLLANLGHLGWDQFTHEPSWTTNRVPFLDQVVAGIPMSRWLMYAFSVLGLVAIAWVMWRELRDRRVHRTPRLRPDLAPWIVRAPVIVAAALAVRTMITVGPYMGTHALLYYMLTSGIAAGAAVLLVLCVVWQLVAPVDGPDGSGRPDAIVPADDRSIDRAHERTPDQAR